MFYSSNSEEKLQEFLIEKITPTQSDIYFSYTIKIINLSSSKCLNFIS